MRNIFEIDKVGSILDVGATILHILGIKSNLGLGRDLFEKKSLIEEIRDLNRKLFSWRDEILKLWKIFLKFRTFSMWDLNRKYLAINSGF